MASHNASTRTVRFIQVFHHSLTLKSILKWPFTHKTTIDMAETCIRFREHGARVMIEEKEIPHYAMHVDPVKKEVSCWIASEAGKVCGPLFSLLSFFLF